MFRAGANFVRVDVFASKDGAPVEDLEASDFEVLEDGVTQAIETFEHVRIGRGGGALTRVEPRTAREARDMAADPRARLFVLFLDTYHVGQASAINVRRPLVNMLNRVVGPEDLLAVMTPIMAASDITFTRRTDLVAEMLDSAGMWGQRDERMKKDPVDQLYEQCYPPAPGTGRATSEVAEAMIQRRREKVTLDAIEELVRYLGGLREERKAILLVSEGWMLYRPARPLAESGTPRMPGVFVGPDGKLRNTDARNMAGANTAQCDQDRVALSMIDNRQRYLNILNLANRANASFYPIEPRGLAVFDNDIGPNPPPLPATDVAMLRTRHEALRTAALNTDGIAVMDSNDIDSGLKRVAADLSSYYLLGYTSTNSKFDGKYRAIRVRVTRPGIEVRARRGYLALTEAEAATMTAAAAPAPSAETVALRSALASLDAIRPDRAFTLSASWGWWMPAGEPLKGQPRGAEPAVWIVGAIDPKARGAEAWTRGGEAEVTVASGGGAVLASYAVPIPAESARFESRFPRSAEDVWLDPGAYTIRVRAQPAGGGLPTTDTVRLTVPEAPGAGRFAFGQPVCVRRGAGVSAAESPVPDRRLRRTERLIVLASASSAPDELSAELLDRRGAPMTLPVETSTMSRDFVQWIRAELALAPLAPGNYIVRLSAKKGGEQAVTLAAFRVVP
ncbi:MAG TPA: VWA domain-containing protein [Vicinamibacterales bacterium]|nr:VWA domain-containing protein [Vicinamibacterales bacterium]HPW19976.1 VWA domain-containing protein [Vicinamibacterales bacterium]